jgi:hypothetical protein
MKTEGRILKYFLATLKKLSLDELSVEIEKSFQHAVAMENARAICMKTNKNHIVEWK